ncbi:CvpA family protein [Bacillus sp. S/N-304-OC-R1]|uniref:CvpA family protein n=1 Tax=Bacillus sp. S/N-304-OC-R1 TaxID=2758034 RepID=UPI001C8D66DD|nr:CvpA family protein [Bacillus sp. S/N-304-OC-R1]MBY0124024.1 CvpA family protein [Bacillus sp. S/N-304-OC-R1]
MLDLAILAILIIGFFVGLKRGFILQLIHLTGFIIAFIVANMYYDKLAPKLTLWVPYPSFGKDTAFEMLFDQANLEDAYYRAIAFVVIFFAVKIVLHMIGSMLDFVANLPILKQLNVWAGGILGFIEIYLIIFILLYIAALVPVDSVQNALSDSIIAEGIIKNTPIFSQTIKEMWIEYMAS